MQENGESEKALEAFERVLNIDPGEIDLATRVAFLLTQQGDYPRAIDILKDAVKGRAEGSPALISNWPTSMPSISRKWSRRFVMREQAVTLAPNEIEGYQRLAEVQLAAGNRKGALQTLDRAAKVETNAPSFWTQLGKLYLRAHRATGQEPQGGRAGEGQCRLSQSARARSGRCASVLTGGR